MNGTKEKILLLLLGGVALGCSYTPHKQRMVLKIVSKMWKETDSKDLRKNINDLYRYKCIGKNKKENGSFEIFLTEKGKWKVLNNQLQNIKNKNGAWDGKWRMVAFDIPEKYKKGRDALRHKLKNIGFCELQKSVLVTHFDCQKEIELLIEFFHLSKYVRFAILEYVDNGLYLKKFFKLA